MVGREVKDNLFPTPALCFPPKQHVCRERSSGEFQPLQEEILGLPALGSAGNIQYFQMVRGKD